MADDSVSGSPIDGVQSLGIQDRLTGVCISFMGFILVFIVSWVLFAKYWKKFNLMMPSLKADNCSRVNSTLHSFIVVPGLIYGILRMHWGSSFEPLDDTIFLDKMLCVTIGYFICDTAIITVYQVPLWGVFVAHHIAASTPYVIYMFASPCTYGLFILSCFMLVEFSNISLNAQSFLEQNGQGTSKYYVAAFYTTFVGWIFCRIVNPVAMLLVLHMKVLPSVPAGQKWCMVPGVICAYLINFFCIGVFVFVLCKEVRLRWQASPDPKEVAPLNDDVRPLDFDNSVIPTTEEERELTMESPARILIHEAREKLHEIETTITVEIERHRSSSLTGFPNLENRSTRTTKW